MEGHKGTLRLKANDLAIDELCFTVATETGAAIAANIQFLSFNSVQQRKLHAVGKLGGIFYGDTLHAFKLEIESAEFVVFYNIINCTNEIGANLRFLWGNLNAITG